MLVLDLGFLSKKHKSMSIRAATIWTFVWITLSLIFAGFIYLYDYDGIALNQNKTKSLEYIAGYLMEKSLSVDNLFVFIMIFQKFRISQENQVLVLKWGIIGALVLRAIMILAGATLIAKFNWILYLFGIFLLYTATKMFLHNEEDKFEPEKNFIFRQLKKFVPLSSKENPKRFFIVENGRWVATTLFIVLVLIETSDIMFAFDSIPAVFSITQDPFIVYTSNIFAILGLRSLFFLINGIMTLFVHLKTGVSLILAFVGAKMLLPLYGELTQTEKIHISINVSLSIIVIVLFISVAVSIPDYLKKKS